MRAPLSKLAKELLDNPESAQRLKEWVDSGEKNSKITLVTTTGQRKQVIATKLNTSTATHGFEPVKRTWWRTVQDFIHNLMVAIINPFG